MSQLITSAPSFYFFYHTRRLLISIHCYWIIVQAYWLFCILMHRSDVGLILISWSFPPLIDRLCENLPLSGFLWWLMINIMRASSSWNLWPHRVKIRISHRVLISARALEINVITLARCWYIRSIRQRPVGKHSAPAPRPSGAWLLRADPCTVKVSLWCLAAAAEIKPFHLLVLRATVVVRIRDEERVGINATRRQTIDQPWKM